MSNDNATQTDAIMFEIVLRPPPTAHTSGTAVSSEQGQDKSKKRGRKQPKNSANKKAKIVNPELENYSIEERKFYNKLTEDDKTMISKTEQTMKNLNNDAVPLRFKVLQSAVDDKIKAAAIQKLNYLYSLDESCQEYYNTINWIESVCKIPFNKYKKLPVDFQSPRQDIRKFLVDIGNNMDDKVYGHKTAKDHIVRLLAQWIANPDAKGMVIGIQGPMGCGKCFARDTGIMMVDGSIKKVQHIKVGDVLMGDDSLPRNVLALGSGRDIMFKVSSSDGESYVVNSEHILCVKIAAKCTITASISGYTVKYFDKDTLSVQHVEFVNREYAVDYANAIPWGEEESIIEIMARDLASIPEHVRSVWLKGYRRPAVFLNEHVAKTTDMDLQQAFDLGVMCAYRPIDYLPDRVKLGPLAVRASFVNGIKSAFENHIIMSTADQLDTVAKDIVFVARSVGYDACLSGGYRARINTKPYNGLTYNMKIEQLDEDVYFGFMIDGNERFLLADFTVTHNTTLIKEGICAALGLPFAFIPLGGASDGCYLDGHSYTYQGATWGKIIDVLMKCGCMNPVMFFDELDKVSDTQKGEEIINILIHLTDPSQNERFNDKYFSDFEFDLSRSLIIFSYNNEDNVNPILRDRMIKIHTNGYQVKDKLPICKKHMIPLLMQEYNFDANDIVFPDDTLKYIIEYIDEEQGVRNLRRALQDIISNINLKRMLGDEEENVKLPYNVTQKDVTTYVHNKKKDKTSHNMIYI